MVLVAVSMTLTSSEPLSSTYRADPSGVTASPRGPKPTGMVPVTVLVAVSMTLTVLSP